jgi:hypothetical protein
LSSSLTKTPARRLSFGQYRGSELKLDLDLRIGQTKKRESISFYVDMKTVLFTCGLILPTNIIFRNEKVV